MHILAETQVPLAIPAILFPLIAGATFTLLGFVTWSFRDVAYRHSQRFEATRTNETGVDEFGHVKY